MQLLLDTHAFLWFVTGDSKLSSTASILLTTTGNTLWVSIASLWEIAIKVAIGKMGLAQPYHVLIPTELQHYGIGMFGITLDHLYRVAILPMHHRDPFDRLLVAQCQHENLPIVSGDPSFDAYGIQRLW